jgi:hypothetical protein
VTIRMTIGAVAGALILAAAIGTAGAETKMPDVLVNEWCSDAVTPPEKTKDGVKTSYVLPSWTPDGHCTGIFAIEPWGFFYGDNLTKSCDPVKVFIKKETPAPSGEGYDVTVSARCYTNGQQGEPMTSTIKTFRFLRYKGSMSVTEGGSKP